MRSLIYANMLWNAAFVIMGLSETVGLTGVHEALPWWFKWSWLISLAGGNLAIHILMLRRTWGLFKGSY